MSGAFLQNNEITTMLWSWYCYWYMWPTRRYV